MQQIKNFNSLDTSRTKVVNIGNSYEQREILGLQVRIRFHQHLYIYSNNEAITQFYPNLHDMLLTIRKF